MQRETIAVDEAERVVNRTRMAELTATSGPPSAAEGGLGRHRPVRAQRARGQPN
jgi:hypothetical protein